MKSFSQFLREAVETLASTEAKNRGLRGDGHGDWYDPQGNFVAKTVGGRLKYFGQGGAGTETQGAQQQQGTQQTQTAAPQATQQQQVPQEQQVNGVAVVIGRFNPPSKNHGALLKAGYSQAKRRGFEFRVYPSRIDRKSTRLNSSHSSVSRMPSSA